MKKRSDLFWFIARILIGFIFVYAGFSKLTEPIENFRGAITEYDVFPYAWVPLIALVVPWIELILGAFLLVGYAPKWSSRGIALLSLGLVIMLASSDMLIHSGSKICGCFGQNGPIRLTLHQVFAMDIVFFLLSLKLSGQKSFLWSLDSWLKH